MAASDARPVPLKNTAFRWYFPILDADGDVVTGAAGLDSEVSIDGAAFADCTNEATEIGSSGIYFLDLTASEMNGDGVVVQVKTTTSGAKTSTGMFYPEEAGDIRVNVTQFGGTNGTFASGRPEVNVSHFGGTAGTFAGGRPETNVSHFGGTAGTFSGGRPEVNASHIGGSAISQASGVANVNVVQISGDSTAADNVEAEYDGTGFKSYLRRNTAQAGAAGTITLDSGASATDDLYNGLVVEILGGTGAGQARLVTDYVGSTKVATVTPNWVTNPDSTSVFALQPFARVDLALWLGVAPLALTSQRVETVVGAYASGQAPLQPTVAGRTLDVTATGAAGIDWGNVENQGTTVGLSATTVSIVSTVNGLAANTVNASAVADGALDRAAFAADTGLQPARSNTAQSGAAGSITLDTGASATDDFYNDMLVFITGGTGAGQARKVSDYVGSTKVASVVPNWVTNPDSSSTFALLPEGRVDLALWLGSAPNALQSGRVDASAGAVANDAITAAAIANGAIDNATFAAGAIDAAALAADAANEIRDAVWAKAMSELASVPGVTGSTLEALEWLFLMSRNRLTQTSTLQTLRNDANSADIATAAVSDDGTTFVRAEFG